MEVAKQGGSRGDGGKWALLMVDARGGRAGTSHASTGHRLPLPMLTSESSPGSLRSHHAADNGCMLSMAASRRRADAPSEVGSLARVSYYAEYVHRLPTYTRVDRYIDYPAIVYLSWKQSYPSTYTQRAIRVPKCPLCTCHARDCFPDPRMRNTPRPPSCCCHFPGIRRRTPCTSILQAPLTLPTSNSHPVPMITLPTPSLVEAGNTKLINRRFSTDRAAYHDRGSTLQHCPARAQSINQSCPEHGPR